MKPRAWKLLSVVLTGCGLHTWLPAVGWAQEESAHHMPSKKLPFHLADYDAEPRLPNGRVDVEQLAGRLKELGLTTYYFLVLHAATDWDDLKLFLPVAARSHLAVWVYLVPPSESPPLVGNLYSEPFRLDYPRWAEEIAKLSLQHPNLTGWVIDDFFANHELFTPAYVRAMQDRARRVNPRLAFLPLMYFNEIRRSFAQDYHGVIDGVVVAYPHDRPEIDRARAVLNDAPMPARAELSFPQFTASKAGDFVSASQEAAVAFTGPAKIRFREREDYPGPTVGYHFKQLLVNGEVVWEEDVAGGTNGWREVEVRLPRMAAGKARLTFRLFEKQGVGNFGVRWDLAEFSSEELKLDVSLEQPDRWRVEQRGSFEAGFGPPSALVRGQWHVPFVLMTASQEIEFRLRHGDAATPERRADWLRMCVQALREGKCDGVVTYCLDKEPGSHVFELARKEFREARNPQNQ